MKNYVVCLADGTYFIAVAHTLKEMLRTTKLYNQFCDEKDKVVALYEVKLSIEIDTIME